MCQETYVSPSSLPRGAETWGVWGSYFFHILTWNVQIYEEIYFSLTFFLEVGS